MWPIAMSLTILNTVTVDYMSIAFVDKLHVRSFKLLLVCGLSSNFNYSIGLWFPRNTDRRMI